MILYGNDLPTSTSITDKILLRYIVTHIAYFARFFKFLLYAWLSSIFLEAEPLKHRKPLPVSCSLSSSSFFLKKSIILPFYFTPNSNSLAVVLMILWSALFNAKSIFVKTLSKLYIVPALVNFTIICARLQLTRSVSLECSCMLYIVTVHKTLKIPASERASSVWYYNRRYTVRLKIWGQRTTPDRIELHKFRKCIYHKKIIIIIKSSCLHIHRAKVVYVNSFKRYPTLSDVMKHTAFPEKVIHLR